MIASSSIGIIGGADGPTAIFITGRFPWETVFAAILLLIAVIWFFRRKE